MNDGIAQTASVADSALEKAGEARQRCDSTIEEIKENYDLLLEVRDRKIKELQGKIAEGTPETVKPRLLVVDDAESTSAIMNRYLDGQPVEMVCVAGSQSLEQLRSGVFDAIMLEASTSVSEKVDGLTLCQALCKKGKESIVVVTSSRPGDKIKHSVEEAGARFLRKPFKRDEVIEIVRSTCLRKRK